MQIHVHRREERVAIETEIRSVDLPGFVAEALNISDSGLLIEFKAVSGQEPRKGDSIAFRVEVGKDRIAEGLARVAWVRRRGLKVRAGLIFELVDRATRDFVAQMLAA